jgi:hypothetical protein
MLKTFMQTLLGNEMHMTSLSHCIVRAERPRSVLSPIPCALGTFVDHMFGSKMLLHQLARLGLCVSWDEVYRYRQSVAQCNDDDLPSEFPMAFTVCS